MVRASRLRQENGCKSERLVWARDPALKSYNQKKNPKSDPTQGEKCPVGPDVTPPTPGKVALVQTTALIEEFLAVSANMEWPWPGGAVTPTVAVHA